MAGVNEEFKFPDEQETSATTANSEELEIEVVDDTPERDRGRKPLGKPVDEPTEEELSQYSDKVKKRIDDLTHARHDERREKERLARERDELQSIAQRLLEENKSLKKTYNAGQEVFVKTANEKAESDLAAAKAKLKKAHEDFDTDAIVEAQAEVAMAVQRLENTRQFKPAPLQESEIELQTQQAQQAPRPDAKSLNWQARNQWFGAQGYEAESAFALGLHQKLVASGIDPRSDEYYAQIDARMQKKFPELFDSDGDDESSPRTRSSSSKPPTVVAPATRSASAGKIRLTQTQLALAQKMGLTPQQYAIEVAKLEKQNG